TWHDIDTGTAKFDLDFGMAETHTADRQPAGISAHVQYLSDLFDHATVVTIADRLTRLLETVTTDPDQPISQAEIISGEERELLLRTWNGTLVAHPDEVPVHELIEQQAARTPDAVAVVSGDSELTYRQLNTRANQLAHHLITHGVQHGSLVAVCLERGPDMITALLGTMKAGAAYVPMDPDYPQQRLEFMLQDTRAPLLITQTSLAGGLPTETQHLLIDEERPTLAALDRTNPAPRATPDSLAYIIYTSGSTGTPKGVMIEHRSLSNRLQEMRQQYALTEADRTLQFASVSFDAAAEQIFPTLMSGGRIVLRDSDKWTATRIIREIRNNGITVAELTPSLWQQILPELDTDHPFGSDFRLMILGGEHVPAKLLGQWFKHTAIPIHNTYGPTETTITATSYRITHEIPIIPIGRPIANTEAYVMDRYG
ncbi:AMP-binding protein, partial [Streptomyces collinus]